MNQDMTNQKRDLLQLKKELKQHSLKASTLAFLFCVVGVVSGFDKQNSQDSMDVSNNLEVQDNSFTYDPLMVEDVLLSYNSSVPINDDLLNFALNDTVSFSTEESFELELPLSIPERFLLNEQKEIERQEEQRRLEEQKRLEEIKRQEEQRRLEEQKRQEELERQAMEAQKAYEEMIHTFMMEHYGLSQEDYDALVFNIMETSQKRETGYTDAVSIETLFYDMASVSNEEKLATILEKYQLSYDEFSLLSACVIAEAKGWGTSYADAYATINCVYNRTKSEMCIKNFGGESLYGQITAPWQFEVYYKDLYQQFLGEQNCLGFQAILDFLYFEVPMHDYINFVAHDPERAGADNKMQFVSRGNRFYNELQDEVQRLALVKEEE